MMVRDYYSEKQVIVLMFSCPSDTHCHLCIVTNSYDSIIFKDIPFSAWVFLLQWKGSLLTRTLDQP